MSSRPWPMLSECPPLGNVLGSTDCASSVRISASPQSGLARSASHTAALTIAAA
jgi:hypothetical protein